MSTRAMCTARQSDTFRSPLSSIPSPSLASSCTTSPFSSPETTVNEMDILDMPMPMFFPNQLSVSSSTPTATVPAYPHTTSVLCLERSQDELLLQQQQQHMHLQMHELQLLQRQQQLQQQQQLQSEIAQIGLDTPPTSPLKPACSSAASEGLSALTPPQQAEPGLFRNLLNVSDPAADSADLSPYQRRFSYSPLHINQQHPQQESPQAQTVSSSPYSFTSDSPFISTIGNPNLGENEMDLFPVTSTATSSSIASEIHSMLYDVSSSLDQRPFAATAGPDIGMSMSMSISASSVSSVDSPLLPLGNIKHEIPSPTTPTISAADSPHVCTCHHNQPGPSSIPPSSYSIIGEDEHASFSRSNSQELDATPAPHRHSHQQQPIRARARPRSMIVSSASYPLLSSAFVSQPYASPYHHDSLSSPSSPKVTGEPYPATDRRRSSSGTYAAFNIPYPVSPLSSTQSTFAYDVGQSSTHSPLHPPPPPPPPQPQQQRPPLQYHPQHQHFQHLLDPEDLPKIAPGSHHCPVCNRFFSRPFNLR
ncbi:hypothetical protein EC968_009279 [Mortierella alpina]|nr:hypothetical protein EC968_009279 [Mortierella alpina]